MLSAPRALFLLASTSLFALIVSAAFGRGPGAATLGALSLGWAVLMTSGVLFPRLEMFGRVVCRGPSGRARVALTFDDGPHPATTPRVLAALASTAHRATFFVLGYKARKYPQLLRDIQAAGHCIGVHGDVHDRLHSFRMPLRVRDEIARAKRAVSDATGFEPRLFRPPIGHTSPATLFGARLSRVTVIGWSARGYDGLRGSAPSGVLRRIVRSLSDGAIILLHDASERDDFEPASLRALPELLHELDSRALTSVRLDEWLSE